MPLPDTYTNDARVVLCDPAVRDRCESPRAAYVTVTTKDQLLIFHSPQLIAEAVLGGDDSVYGQKILGRSPEVRGEPDVTNYDSRASAPADGTACGSSSVGIPGAKVPITQCWVEGYAADK